MSDAAAPLCLEIPLSLVVLVVNLFNSASKLICGTKLQALELSEVFPPRSSVTLVLGKRILLLHGHTSDSSGR